MFPSGPSAGFFDSLVSRTCAPLKMQPFDRELIAEIKLLGTEIAELTAAPHMVVLHVFIAMHITMSYPCISL